jgi:DNA polymerase/3'-5' exonuclease PolX
MDDYRNKLIETYQGLVQYQSTVHDKGWNYKIKNYKNAITAIEDYDNPILSIDNVREAFTEFGMKNPVKLLDKAIKIFNNEEIEVLKGQEERIKIIEILTSVPWIGNVASGKLYEQGIRSIKDLRKALKKNEKLLNKNQKIGLMYYDDLIDPKTLDERRIPRKEIKRFDNILKEVFIESFPRVQYVIAGSYRRKCETSGDIDLLINAPIVSQLIRILKQMDIDIITLSSGDKKYMGIIRIKKDEKYRRIDILYTSPDEYPFAVCYFTGSKKFNTKMRARALVKGFTMNEHEIKLKNGDRITSKDIMKRVGKNEITIEKDVFKFLEMEYVKPLARNVI